MSLFPNKNNLRIVKTIYTAEELNTASKKGHVTILEPINLNPDLYQKEILLKNYSTGEFVEVPAREFYVQYGKLKSYPESEWQLISTYKKYARPKRLNQSWAAYVLPISPEKNERFYIEDIIEDIMADNFWYSIIVASSGEAVWTGLELKIDLEPIKRFRLIG